MMNQLIVEEYRGWQIFVAHDDCPLNYEFAHKDYDCADDCDDTRYGTANTIEDAKAQIDDAEAA